MRDLGYLEGQNIAFDYAYGDGVPERLAEAAAALVRRPVDVIATYGTPDIRPGRNRSVLLAPVSTIAGFFSTIQSFDRSRSATRRAISADASSGIGNTELTLISPST